MAVAATTTSSVLAMATSRGRRRPQISVVPSRRRRRGFGNACVKATGDGSAAVLMDDFFRLAADPNKVPDRLVSLLCDDVIEAGMAQRKFFGNEAEALTLEDCLSATPLSPFLDSFAVRACQFSTIVQHEVQSAMTISGASQVQRHSVTLATGEVMMLTFSLCLETSLRARYKGIACDEQWFLRKISGEWEDLLDEPSPTAGPEACVARQLQALKERDVATVFRFASPANQLVTGPIERFASMLMSPTYSVLVGHTDAEVMQGKHFKEDTFLALVRAVSTSQKKAPPAMFVWTVKRQADSGSWMTESVQACNTAFTWLASDDMEGRSA